MSAPIAIRVMIADDHHGGAHRRWRRLATWPMGKSPTWLMTLAAASGILESKEGLGNSNTGGRDARFT